MVTFSERDGCPYVLVVLCLFVILVISRVTFEGGIWVLIVPVSWSLLTAYFVERRDVILTRQRKTDVLTRLYRLTCAFIFRI